MSPVSPPIALSPGEAMGSLLLLFSVAFFLSLSLTPLVREAARTRGWVDRPDGLRKAHLAPVPRPGGVAVYLSFVVAFALSLAVLRDAPWYGETVVAGYLHLVAACTAVMLVGLVDDLHGVTPLAKLLVQAGAGLYLYEAGYQIQLVSNPFGEPIALGALSLPVTLLWFVAMSNAFNLIDGLDGLAAGVGVFSSSLVFIFALMNERWEIALLAVALGGALLGFLRYNFSPASVFMGDSGSLFVGFALAALSIRGSMKSSTAIAVVAPLLAMGVPLVDTGLALVRRLLGGRSILEPDADHIHHRMVRRGLTPQRAVVMLYGVTALFGTLSLLTMTGQAHITGLVTLVFTVVTWVGIRLLGGLRREPAADGFEVGRLRKRFCDARDLAELWEGLVEAGSRWGFESLALSLEAVAGSSGPTRGDPRERIWRRDEAVDPKGTWSWTIPLVSGGQVLGELTITRRIDGASSTRDMFELFEAFSDDLADALRRVEAAGASSTG